MNSILRNTRDLKSNGIFKTFYVRELFLWTSKLPTQYNRRQHPWGLELGSACPASRGEVRPQRLPGTPAYLSPASPASIIHALVFLAEPQLLQPSILRLIDEQSGHEGGRPVQRSRELALPCNVHAEQAGKAPHTEPERRTAPASRGAAEIGSRPPPGGTHWAGPVPPTGSAPSPSVSLPIWVFPRSSELQPGA